MPATTHTPNLHFKPWRVLSVESPHPTSACGCGTACTSCPAASIFPLGYNKMKQRPKHISSLPASSWQHTPRDCTEVRHLHQTVQLGNWRVSACAANKQRAQHLLRLRPGAPRPGEGCHCSSARTSRGSTRSAPLPAAGGAQPSSAKDGRKENCPTLRTYLCRTVEPAARGATALLGERPEEPTLVALGLGPGCGK